MPLIPCYTRLLLRYHQDFITNKLKENLMRFGNYQILEAFAQRASGECQYLLIVMDRPNVKDTIRCGIRAQMELREDGPQFAPECQHRYSRLLIGNALALFSQVTPG